MAFSQQIFVFVGEEILRPFILYSFLIGTEACCPVGDVNHHHRVVVEGGVGAQGSVLGGICGAELRGRGPGVHDRGASSTGVCLVSHVSTACALGIFGTQVQLLCYIIITHYLTEG